MKIKARKLIFEIKEEHEQIRMRKRVIAPASGSVCSECGEDVEWLSVPEASVAIGLQPEELLKVLAGDRLHFSAKPGGGLLICGNTVAGMSGRPLLTGK